MTTFDTIAAIIVLGSIVYSLFRGFVRESFALVSYAAAYLAAQNFYLGMTGHTGKFVGNATGAKLTAWILVFCAVFFAVRLAGYLAKKLVHGGGLSLADRVFGGLLGFLKGVFILVIVLSPLELFPDFYRDVTRDSRFAPQLQQISHKLRFTNDVTKNIMDQMPAMDAGKITETLMDQLPAMDAGKITDEIRNKLPALEAGKITEEMKEKAVGSVEQLKRELDEKTGAASKTGKPVQPKKGGGKPLDNITPEDQDKLNKLFDSLK